MSERNDNNKGRPTQDDYQPLKKGYQPQQKNPAQGGYTPPTQSGDNPTNQPTPPGKE